jgi:calcium-dependent protein kinase
MKTKIGTPYYMAPEVLDGEYDQTCDMWSLGVITYCMLCGYPPFNAESDLQLFRKIKSCDYEFHLPEWGPVSEDAKRFIESLIRLEPSQRLTPEQALAHPWITSRGGVAEHLSAVSKRVLSRLALFQKPTLFQKHILLLLAALLNSKELKDIRDTFSAIDVDSSGTITLGELSAAFLQAGQAELSASPPNLSEIIRRVDFDENGEINYSEFVSGTLDRTLLNQENLRKVFMYLLEGKSEVLTYKSLKQAFQRKGDFDLTYFNRMMTEIGLYRETQALSLTKAHSVPVDSHSELEHAQNSINFERFCALMGT